MTAQSSTGKFSKFGTYFLYKLRTLRPLIILNGIFALLSYPFAGGILVGYASIEQKMLHFREQPGYYENNMFESAEYLAMRETETLFEGLMIMSMIVGVAMLVGMFIMSYAIISKSFRWLYKKTIVDMDYSLPVSDETRFFGDILASFAGSLVPHLIAVFSGSILFRVAMSFVEDDSDVVALLDCLLPEQAMYTGLFSCIMFMAFSLFVISLCGRGAEARMYPFVITGIVPVIHIICRQISLTNVYGLSYSMFDIAEMLNISGTSPLGLIFVSILYIFGSSSYRLEEARLPLFRAGIGITALVITMGLFVAAYFLIKKRRAERVGSPYVFNIVKTIIPALVTFAVVLPFMLVTFEMTTDWDEANSYTPSAVGVVVAMIIVTFILYVIMELISGKGFKRFHITLLKYIATMAVSLLICFGLHASNGFGIGNYVPDINDVAEISFSLDDNHSNNRLGGVVLDEDSIGRIIEVHESHPKQPNEDDTYRFTFSVDYRMKDGTIVYRDYRITEEQYKDYTQRILSPETFYATQRKYYYDYGYEDGDVIFRIAVQNSSVDSAEYEVEIPYDDFFNAYRKDCDAVTYEKAFCIGDGMYKVDLWMSYDVRDNDGFAHQRYDGIHLYSWMENTIALLEQHGIGDVGRVDLSLYKTAFLIEYDADAGYYASASPEAAFIMTGDTSVSKEELDRYGYAYNFMYIKDYEAVYGGEAESGKSYIATTGAYGYGGEAICVAVEDTNVTTVDFRAYPLDIGSPDTEKMLKNCNYERRSYIDSDVVYSILLVDAVNMAELINNGAARDEYFLSTEYYDMAAEIAAAA